MLEGNLGTLSQSTDQGKSSGTRLACGSMPHPSLERGVDENPKPLSGNRTAKAKVSDVVVRSPDASSLSVSNSVSPLGLDTMLEFQNHRVSTETEQ